MITKSSAEVDIATGEVWNSWASAEKLRIDAKGFMKACLRLGDDTQNPYEITTEFRITSGGQFLDEVRAAYGDGESAYAIIFIAPYSSS
jgi:hypothetical protein